MANLNCEWLFDEDITQNPSVSGVFFCSFDDVLLVDGLVPDSQQEPDENRGRSWGLGEPVDVGSCGPDLSVREGDGFFPHSVPVVSGGDVSVLACDIGDWYYFGIQSEQS